MSFIRFYHLKHPPTDTGEMFGLHPAPFESNR